MNITSIFVEMQDFDCWGFLPHVPSSKPLGNTQVRCLICDCRLWWDVSGDHDDRPWYICNILYRIEEEPV